LAARPNVAAQSHHRDRLEMLGTCGLDERHVVERDPSEASVGSRFGNRRGAAGAAAAHLACLDRPLPSPAVSRGTAHPTGDERPAWLAFAAIAVRMPVAA